MRGFLVAVGLLALAACGQQSTTPTVGDEAFDLGADQVIFYVTMQMTEKGIRKAELSADTAYTFEDSKRMDMRGVEVVFYREDGSQAGTLTANTADYYQGDNSFVARENVVLITPGENGERRLETEELHFDLAGDRLWTDSPFVIYEAGRVTRGSRFTTDSKLRTWDVTGLQTEGEVNAGGGLTF